ncbi:hypothetical protein AURDEDRAFT_152508 [Auricularia subglabra TFB-10046 SS5]|nr:hypothetical protein AURDEDRAFT_152508 [Auricularia subglabra TFB-10046 SS5]
MGLFGAAIPGLHRAPAVFTHSYVWTRPEFSLRACLNGASIRESEWRTRPMASVNTRAADSAPVVEPPVSVRRSACLYLMGPSRAGRLSAPLSRISDSECAAKEASVPKMALSTFHGYYPLPRSRREALTLSEVPRWQGSAPIARVPATWIRAPFSALDGRHNSGTARKLQKSLDKQLANVPAVRTIDVPATHGAFGHILLPEGSRTLFTSLAVVHKVVKPAGQPAQAPACEYGRESTQILHGVPCTSHARGPSSYFKMMHKCCIYFSKSTLPSVTRFARSSGQSGASRSLNPVADVLSRDAPAPSSAMQSSAARKSLTLQATVLHFGLTPTNLVGAAIASPSAYWFPVMTILSSFLFLTGAAPLLCERVQFPCKFVSQPTGILDAISQRHASALLAPSSPCRAARPAPPFPYPFRRRPPACKPACLTGRPLLHPGLYTAFILAPSLLLLIYTHGVLLRLFRSFFPFLRASRSGRFAYAGAPGSQTPSPIEELARLDNLDRLDRLNRLDTVSAKALEVIFDFDGFQGSLPRVLSRLAERMCWVRSLTIRSPGVIFHAYLDPVLRANAPQLTSLSIQADVMGDPRYHAFLPGSAIETLCVAPALLGAWDKRKRMSERHVKRYSTFVPAIVRPMEIPTGLDTLFRILPSLAHVELDIRSVSAAKPALDLKKLMLNSLTLLHGEAVEHIARVTRLLSLLRVPDSGQTVVVYGAKAKSICTLWSHDLQAPRELVVGTSAGGKRQVVLRWPTMPRTVYWREALAPDLGAVLLDDAVRSARSLTLASVLAWSEIAPLAGAGRVLDVAELTVHIVEPGYSVDEERVKVIKHDDRLSWACPNLAILKYTSRAIFGAAPPARTNTVVRVKPVVHVRDVVRFLREMKRPDRPLQKIVFEGVDLDEKDGDAEAELRALADDLSFKG